MNSMMGKGEVREIVMEATVMGPCKHCGVAAEWWPDNPCSGAEHEATFTRPLGTIARWHKSAKVRAWWALQDKMKRSGTNGC